MTKGPLRAALFRTLFVAGVLGGLPTQAGAQAPAQDQNLPVYLRDRGTGQLTSMFGTYIRKGELLLYPFFEGYVDNDKEYKPSDLGYGLDTDLRGRFRATEELVFLGYGLTDWLAVEFEASIIQASLATSPDDPTGVPDKITESGISDIEGQFRARLITENEGRPEVFSYFEWVSPNGQDKVLLGTPDWEYKFGGGVIKGSRVGTFTLRLAGEYSMEESKLDTGEYAVEYLKRLSPAWRVYLGVEGTQDEVELITELQWHFTDRMFFKFNNGFGLTSKATGWAPEIGIMFSLPTRQTN